MAWYRCGGGGSGKDRPIYKTVKLYQGKIAHSNGQVVEDSSYYYTDYFPIGSSITFDMGMSTNSDNYAGLYMYKDDKSYVSNWYWNPNQRYRHMYLDSQVSQGASWLRMSFPADKLNYAMTHDWEHGIMYSTEEVVRITDKESHDIDLIPNPATSENTEPFANSEYAAELAVWKAFDKSKSTFWASANSNGDKYIGWKFSSAVAVNKVYMAIGSNSGWETRQAPNTWFVEGSNDDGTTWTFVNYNEHSWTNANEEIEYEFLNETAYKWWRIRITRTMDGTSGCASLAELDFYNVCDSYQLGTKTITENGTYSARSDGVDGYSEVTANVDNIEPSPALPNEYQLVEYLNIQAGYFIIDLPVKGIYKCTFSTSESSTYRSQGVFGGRYNKSSNNDRDWYVTIANDLSTARYWNRLYSYDISVNTITSLSTNTKYTVWGNVIYPTGTNRQAYIGAYNPWDGGTSKTSKYEFYGNFYGVTGYMVNPSSTYTLSPTCDYVPCYRKSDDQVGVYDVVNSIFYTPTLLTVGGVQGTVTAGPDVDE